MSDDNTFVYSLEEVADDPMPTRPGSISIAGKMIEQQQQQAIEFDEDASEATEQDRRFGLLCDLVHERRMDEWRDRKLARVQLLVARQRAEIAARNFTRQRREADIVAQMAGSQT